MSERLEGAPASVLSTILGLAAGLGAGRRSGVDRDADTPLGAGGFWLDSLALVELLVACEAHFGIRFDPAELAPAHVTTPRALAELVERRLGLAARGGA